MEEEEDKEAIEIVDVAKDMREKNNNELLIPY